jgi:MFS family permease
MRGELRRSPSPGRLVAAMCAAELLTMAGVFSFPAILPELATEWDLTNTGAGWINGIYFAGYALAVPFLASLTDRVDARGIYVAFATVASAASFGFATIAQGFWTALVFRALGGLGLAGTFVPGLKALVDRLAEARQARAVSFYTATFGLGTSLSFFATGQISAALGWRWAFAFAAGAAALGLVLAAAVLGPRPPEPMEAPPARLLDVRPVLRNLEAMRYVLAYSAHTWELFSFRSWVVAFLAFTLGRQPEREGYWAPATVAAAAGLVAMWANVGGAELALRFGRRRTITLVMVGSALCAATAGLAARAPYSAVALFCVLYASFAQGDSAALHISTVQSASVDRRGTTMAVQSLLGFVTASLGPLAVGVVLDAFGGGQSVLSWAAAFAAMGVASALGPVFLPRTQPAAVRVQRS